MRVFVSTVMVCLAMHGTASSQVTADVVIDRGALVGGVSMKSASVKKDIKSGKAIGIQVSVMTWEKNESYMRYFDCRYRYYDRSGKMIADTTVTHYTPVERPVNMINLEIDEETGDTLMVPNPNYHAEEEERRYQEMMAKRLFNGYIRYWPPKAVRAKVGLHKANYGMTTYYALLEPSGDFHASLASVSKNPVGPVPGCTSVGFIRQ